MLERGGLRPNGGSPLISLLPAMASPCSSPLFLSAALLLLLLLVLSASAAEDAAASEASATEEAAAAALSHVLNLGGSNFSEHVSKYPFVVVEFYAPWCGHCKKLEPEYEKAAATLSGHEPPIVLAKVDATVEDNRELARKYDVKGYPTMVILRNGGKTSEEYKGPRDADGIVEYVKKQAGPASHEIMSAQDAETAIDRNKVVIAGVFSEFSGKEFDNFIAVAEKLRADYDFVHTLEPRYLPKGEPTAKKPFIRLLKPFDELFVDSKDFEVDVLEKFIDESSTPLVTIYDKDPNSYDYVVKYFKSDNTKAMIFLNFSSSSNLEEFKSKYHDVAKKHQGGKISFLLGDLDNSPNVLQFFGLKEEQIPVLAIQTSDAKKFIKPNLEPDQIAVFLKDFLDGKVKAHVKSEPIPEVNTEPVKVVVANNFDDVVYKSGKNVFIEFYAPWCGHCKQLAPTFDEVAVSFENDPDVILVKMDATANDVPNGFDVKGFPTMYFSSASGAVVQYEGNRTKEDLIEFIQKNRSPPAHPESVKDSSAEADPVKDEL